MVRSKRAAPTPPFTFFLGTHHPEWLAKTAVPLFVSRRRLELRKALPRARGAWALDSGGFTELSLNGAWSVSPREYVGLVRRFDGDIGRMQWAAIQDWMCEPPILAKTGLTIAEHQTRTTRSWLELMTKAPELPWVPVLQGWTRSDYLRHLDAYARAGTDLTRLPLVGLGSICRRQHTIAAVAIVEELSELGLRVHAFGFKTKGLLAASSSLTSSDSLAWSYNARRNPPLPECSHRRCSNCLRFALLWRRELLTRLARTGRC